MGINNSILIGSDVKMGDPGVSLSLKDVKMDRGFQLLSKKKESDFVSYLCLMTLFAFIVLTILFLLTYWQFEFFIYFPFSLIIFFCLDCELDFLIEFVSFKNNFVHVLTSKWVF